MLELGETFLIQQAYMAATGHQYNPAYQGVSYAASSYQM